MAGIDTSSYGNPTWNSVSSMLGNSSKTNSTGFDYKAVLDSANKQYNDMKAKLTGAASTSDTSVSTMKKDAAAYLDKYTAAMTDVLKSTGKLTNGGLDKLLYNSDGEMNDDTIKAATDAVQSLVDSYNSAIKLLGDNTDRGKGNSTQLARMAARPPLSQQGMEMLGITVGKDGTLTLDADALKKAITDADGREDNGAQMSFIKGLIGDLTGKISSDAQAGLNVPAEKLINNNLAEIQSSQSSSNPYAEMYTMIRGNPMILNNNAALSMMNFSV